MGKGKERLYPDKKQNNYKYCTYADNPDRDVLQECMRPWSDRCKGNLHMCKKLRYQFFASLSKKDRERYKEMWGIE